MYCIYAYLFVCTCVFLSFLQDWGPDRYRNCLLQCLTSITSTVTLTALARCQWSSHLELASLKLTANSWFLPSSVWSIMVCGSKKRLQVNISAHSQFTWLWIVCYFYLCRYWGGPGVHGGTTSPCSTIIQGKLLLYRHVW